MRGLRHVVAGLALAALAAPAFADSGSVSVGVAAFEVEAPEGATVPELGRLLAENLDSRGVARVVSPADLGAPANLDAASSEVQSWAAAADVDAVVVGRTTRNGDRLSVDFRVRDGGSGALTKSLEQEIAGPAELSAALDAMATGVIDATSGISAAAPAVAAASSSEAGGGDGPFGFGDWDSDAPLSIESEKLDIKEENGRRRLIFDGNVRASQGTLSVKAAHLVAIYPESGSDPERLEARGNVRLVQKDQKARCNGATYDRQREILTCRGDAAFRDGDTCLGGSEIVIDLRRETVKVNGSASVLVRPDGEGCPL